MAASLNPDARSFDFSCNDFAFKDVSDVSTARRTLVVRELPHNIPKEEIEQAFQSENAPRLLRASYAGNKRWYFEFENEQAAIRAIWYLLFEVKYIYGSKIKAGLKSSVPQSYQDFRSSIIPRLPQRFAAYNSTPFISGQPLLSGHGVQLYPAQVNHYASFNGTVAYSPAAAFFSGPGASLGCTSRPPEFAAAVVNDVYVAEFQQSDVEVATNLENLTIDDNSVCEKNVVLPPQNESSSGISNVLEHSAASESGHQLEVCEENRKKSESNETQNSLTCGVPHSPLPQRNSFPRPFDFSSAQRTETGQSEKNGDSNYTQVQSSLSLADATNDSTKSNDVASRLPSVIDDSSTTSETGVRPHSPENVIARNSTKTNEGELDESSKEAIKNGISKNEFRKSSNARNRERSSNGPTSYAEVLTQSLGLNDTSPVRVSRPVTATKPLQRSAVPPAATGSTTTATATTTTSGSISNVDKENFRDVERFQNSVYRVERKKFSKPEAESNNKRYGNRFQQQERSNSFGSRFPATGVRRDFNERRRRRDNDDFGRFSHPRDGSNSRPDEFRSNENRRNFNFTYGRRRNDDYPARRNPFLNDNRNQSSRTRTTPVTDL